MTPNEIATMSRVVAPRFGLWTPGQNCTSSSYRLADECSYCGSLEWSEHELPCPDLTEPAWFVGLLKELIPVEFNIGTILIGNKTSTKYACTPANGYYAEADTPEEALLRAAYRFVQRDELVTAQVNRDDLVAAQETK